MFSNPSKGSNLTNIQQKVNKIANSEQDCKQSATLSNKTTMHENHQNGQIFVKKSNNNKN